MLIIWASNMFIYLFIYSVCLFSHLHGAVDPRQNSTDFGVNSRFVLLPASSAPACDPYQVPRTVSLILAHQRSTTVTLINANHSQW